MNRSKRYARPDGGRCVACGACVKECPRGAVRVDQGCEALVGMALPAGVTTLGRSVFEGCIRLEWATLPPTLTAIGPTSFYGCRSLRWVAVPDGVARLADEAFYGCHALTSVTLGRGIESVGPGTFAHCTRIAELGVLAPSPPQVSPQAFHPSVFRARLHVPPGSAKAYSRAPFWKTFRLTNR